jgi:hypothetical protein
MRPGTLNRLCGRGFRGVVLSGWVWLSRGLWMALSDAGRAAMAYSGPIAAAVRLRASTSQIWDAIRNAADQVPGGAPLPSVQGVNEIRGLFAQARNATEALSAARDLEERTGLPQGVTGAMTSTGFRSRSADVLQTAADYLVRFERQYVTPLGQAGSQWVTARFPAGQLPATVGELIDSLSTFAPGTGTPTLGNFSGIGSINITAV